MSPGEYRKGLNPNEWWIYPPPSEKYPTPHIGRIAIHTVEEHEDGTITVSPSIRELGYQDMPDAWHGFLKHGVWSEA